MRTDGGSYQVDIQLPVHMAMDAILEEGLRPAPISRRFDIIIPNIILRDSVLYQVLLGLGAH